MKTIAFSRVRLRAPTARPKTRNCAGNCISTISHSIRQTKNTSSTDFCSSASKNIAGAYMASIPPASKPARIENSLRAAAATSTQEHEPITACTIRTRIGLRPATQ